MGSRCACLCLGQGELPAVGQVVMGLIVSTAAGSMGGNSSAMGGVLVDKTARFTESRNKSSLLMDPCRNDDHKRLVC